MEIDNIYNMDCLDGMRQIPDGSIDAVICDLPYGTTACAWDSVIPTADLWEQYRRVLKPNGAMVLFCSQPFTSVLIASNLEDFSHQWIWEKGGGANPFLATKMPIKTFEEICVFYVQFSPNDWRREYFAKVHKYIGKSKKQIIDECGQPFDHCFRYDSHQFTIPTEDTYKTLIDKYGIDKMEGFLPFEEIAIKRYERIYNPQKVIFGKPVRKGAKVVNKSDGFLGGAEQDNISVNNEYYPSAIINFPKEGNSWHPTQKPVDLLRYLVLTYTNEGDTVLDNCMGSGTTAIACIKEKRHFIGFELSKEYFDKAQRRIKAEQAQLTLF